MLVNERETVNLSKKGIPAATSISFCTRNRCLSLMMILFVGFVAFFLFVEPDVLSVDDSPESSPSNEFSNNLFDQIDEDLDIEQDVCNSTINPYPYDSHNYWVHQADCGLSYDYSANHQGQQIKVVWYAKGLNFELTGCAKGNTCPLFPGCRMYLSEREKDFEDADVVIYPTKHHEKVSKLVSLKKNHFKVLFWREAYWPAPRREVQLSTFDVNVGVQFMSQIVNPNFLRRPRGLRQMPKIFISIDFKHRKNFAISVMSDCGAAFRNAYIEHLVDYLGETRVHRYGDCGDRKLPPKPISNAIEVISRYKFYLSFENTVQDGYATEKLFTVLSMGILPVYLGHPSAPNITSVPSYIKVSDFSSPKSLALYLLNLAEDEEAYNRYHLWRKDPKYFTLDYLKLIAKKLPGKPETRMHQSASRMTRRATCCRVCDLKLLETTSKERALQKNYEDVVSPAWGEHEIDLHFFTHGRRRPGPGHVLKPDTH